MSVLIGKKAPRFSSIAVINGGEVVEGFSLQQYIGKKYVVLFFYPADFTFICPKEIWTFQKYLPDFEALNTVIVGCSVDSLFAHLQWLKTERTKGGIKGITFPLIVDESKTIAKSYDVLAGDYSKLDGESSQFVGTPMAFRGLFLIDKNGVVQHQLVNNFSLARSVKEVLRVVEALQAVEENGDKGQTSLESELED